MGRELARQLRAEGCHVAMCDVSAENMAETATLCLADAPAGHAGHDVRRRRVGRGAAAGASATPSSPSTTPTTSTCCSTTPASAAAAASSTDAAGRVGDARSTSAGAASTWACRTFLPMLLARRRGAHRQHRQRQRVLGVARPEHPAHRLQRRQVRGEGLHRGADHRPAPATRRTCKCSVVMPGHIGTSIVINSRQVLRPRPEGADRRAAAETARPARQARPRRQRRERRRPPRRACRCRPRCSATRRPTTAAQAATIILDGVRAERWRILVGDDAVSLDELVREYPNDAYDDAFLPHLKARGLFSFATG